MSFNKFERKHAEGFYTEKDLEAIYTMQDGQCYFCGEKLGSYGSKGAYQIDHLEPISKGGTNWPGNLALTCSLCNNRKHSNATSALWSKLKKEKGVEWVKARVSNNRKNTPQKTKLTKVRKNERRQSLDMLGRELEAAIIRNIIKYGFSPPEEIYVSVEHNSYYMDINFNNSAISIAAPTQKMLNSWRAEAFDMLAVALLRVEYVSGYLGNV
ncbi:MAG: hypothetical protein CVV05_16260 [Gammaproteobacteria bacterium HGW-Gammaproteobacteria-1]|jgi:5-methylcytosine-specific restriction endonuclease McrA|nr:MAG: hypothetical protein CVV05_16260 [Gammaproteobacteria bacterium HGW-Gammaproteobacteria-1]